MRPTIRPSRSLESSFLHARCQASSYAVARVVKEVMPARARERCDGLGRPRADHNERETQRKVRTLQPPGDPPISRSSTPKRKCKDATFLERTRSSCEKCSPITPATERSNPIRGPESEAEVSRRARALHENRGRRTPGAAGRWLTPPAARSVDEGRKAFAFALAMTALVPGFFNLRSSFMSQANSG